MTDFTPEELEVVNKTLLERFGKNIDIQLADTELRLDQGDRELVNCAAVYWEARDCHFVISKITTDRFHCQFFYSGSEQYGTGVPEYDDILNCVVALLQVQADHEAQSTKS